MLLVLDQSASASECECWVLKTRPVIANIPAFEAALSQLQRVLAVSVLRTALCSKRGRGCAVALLPGYGSFVATVAINFAHGGV